MNATRVSLVIVGVVAAAVWAAGMASTCLVRPGAPQAPAQAPADSHMRPPRAAPAGSSQALVTVHAVRSRQSGTPAGSLVRRDPFRERQTIPAPSARVDEPSSASVGAAVAAPDVPPFRLLGMVGRQTAGRETRTAVISDGRQLWLVQVGELVAGRYEVTALAPDTATLTDRSGGALLIIRLQG